MGWGGAGVSAAGLGAWDPWSGCTPHPCVLAYEDQDDALGCCLLTEGTRSTALLAPELDAFVTVLSPEAAVCAAQAQGFVLAEGPCTASFTVFDAHRLAWEVGAVIEEACEDGVGHRVEEMVWVDALSGRWFRRAERWVELVGCG